MDKKLKIPKIISVGFQQREGTYTGKLAYVIYKDDKGVLRKEKSWQWWRDKAIAPEEFPNEPTSGFVLNKGVGGVRHSYGWNPRNEYIRVYDPRGFEFEISVANLLFILGECTSTKGKGLEGDFVYSWDGTNLVLLPVDCNEYRESSNFTELQTMKVTKEHMKEGRTYTHKNTDSLVYMGRHKVRRFDKLWAGELVAAYLSEPSKSAHVFWNLTQEEWHFEDGFTRLANVISEDCYPEFADLHTKFKQSRHASPAGKLVLTPIDKDLLESRERWNSPYFFIKVPNGYQLAMVTKEVYRGHHTGFGWNTQKVHPTGQSDSLFWPLNPIIHKEVGVAEVNMNRHEYDVHQRTNVSLSFLEGKELFVPEIQFEHETLGVDYYVQRRQNQSVS